MYINSAIITEKIYKDFMDEYCKQCTEIKRRIQLIKEGRIHWGLQGEDYDSYYPVEFKEIVDEYWGIVRMYEPSIDKMHEDSILMFVEVKPDFKED